MVTEEVWNNCIVFIATLNLFVIYTTILLYVPAHFQKKMSSRHNKTILAVELLITFEN